MNFAEFMFIIAFLACIGITLYKIYNIVSLGQAYDKRIAWLLLIGYLLSWGVALILVMFEYSTGAFGVLLRILNIILILHLPFILFEIYYDWEQVITRPFRSSPPRRE